MFFKRSKPKSAAELANEAEIEKLSEEATRGELDNEVQVSRRSSQWRRRGPVGFFNSPGVTLRDDEPYPEEPYQSERSSG